jgi:hypothetical protein
LSTLHRQNPLLLPLVRYHKQTTVQSNMNSNRVLKSRREESRTPRQLQSYQNRKTQA